MTDAQKKVMGKGGLVALAVIVVILSVSNVWTYTNLQNQISTLINETNASQSQVNTLTTEKTSLQSQLNTLTTTYQNYVSTHSHSNSEYDTLKSEQDLLNDIVNLRKSQILIDRQTISQPATKYTPWTFTLKYAGYISVTVHSSTTDNTFVEVVYNSYGVSFDQKITVGVSGVAVFPVIPAFIEVRVGNTNWWFEAGATETVTVTYYY